MNSDEIICNIDKSGSMGAIASDAVGGFNTFLEGIRTEDKDGLFTLILFNQGYEIVHHSSPLEDIKPLDMHTYRPGGLTALHDAVGITLSKAIASYKGKIESVKPSGVTVAILTDGLENASQKFDSKQAAALIDEAREQYGWEFVFLAANQDALLTARGLNIPSYDAANFKASNDGIRLAMHDMTFHVGRHRDMQKKRHS